jgi:tetratricopeptide (TPR) repeat protein
LERYPDDLWLLRGLATAEVKLGRHSEAVRLYEKLLEFDPNDRFSYKELMRLRTAGAPEGEAASALKGLMRSGGRGKNPYLKALAADRLRGAGMLREAAAEYEAALSLEPGNAYALAQLGFCYRRLGDIGKAIDTLGKAFLADPTNPYVRRTLESMCKKDNRRPYLLDLVDEALKLHPDVKSLYGFRKRAAKPGKNTK